jgi:hypothetical protein
MNIDDEQHSFESKFENCHLFAGAGPFFQFATGLSLFEACWSGGKVAMEGLSAAEKFEIITREIPRGEGDQDYVIGADEIKAILETGRDINLYWGTGGFFFFFFFFFFFLGFFSVI